MAIQEIASMLGVSKQRVSAIIKSHPDFPEPDDELSIGRVWKRSRVEAWIEEYDKSRRRRGGKTGQSS